MPAKNSSPRETKLARLERENLQVTQSLEFFQERLAELELSLEDLNWTRLTSELSREFSREGLKRLFALSRYHYLKNPLIKRAVEIQKCYVFALGLEIEAEDKTVNQIIQDFLDDPRNRVEFTGHVARGQKEVDLQVLGNLFFVHFMGPDGTVTLRTIPVEEIQEIITNPDDSREHWYYRRQWTQRTYSRTGQPIDTPMTAYYPAITYAPRAKRMMLGGFPVLWDSPVRHIKEPGLSDMKWGVPATYAAMDWAKAHTEFLSDWASITKALARFAWDLSVKGGAAGIAAAKSKLGTKLATSGTITADTNPPPVTASTFVRGDGTEMKPIKTAGSTTSSDEGRQLKLQVSAGMGIPEHMFGDINSGNLATAKSLDRPTELQFRDRQAMWTEVIQAMLNYVIDCKIQAGELGEAVDRTINVTWPPILEHDKLADVNAIVQAATLGGYTKSGTLPDIEITRLLAQALGIVDVDDILKAMPFDADGMLPEPEPAPVDPKSPQARVAEAVRRLRDQMKLAA